jgi:hypothetical protein
MQFAIGSIKEYQQLKIFWEAPGLVLIQRDLWQDRRAWFSRTVEERRFSAA